MLANHFSPLAPVVVLLLSAFVLSIITPRLPEAWRSHWPVRYALAPGLIVLAGLFVLGTKLANPVMLSGWHFGTAESGAGLDIGIYTPSLPFLLLTIILLLVVTLISLPLDPAARGRGWTFTLGAGAMLLFVSTNRLTLAYTVLLFDILLAYHWFVHKRPNLAIARLFLGILTTGALMLNTNGGGATLLGLALWLRLGLYPFFEIRASEKQVQNYNFLAYWSLSLAVGMYFVTSILTTPLPEILRWLVVITMLLNGLLSWLFQANTAERPTLLTRLVFTQALLPFLLLVPGAEINAAFTLGLTLSMATLWSTPRLGPMHINNLIKFWPYLPALTATLTLIGLPLWLNWPMWTIFATFYPASFSTNVPKTLLLVLALILAMSGLTRYWLKLWFGESQSGSQLHLPATIAALVAAVPFLVPGLAPLLLSGVTQAALGSNSDKISLTLIIITIITAGAIGLGYFRTHIITRFSMSPAVLIKIFDLQWMLVGIDKLLNQISKFVLRVNVIFEGQHYIGWALFTALVGSLIVILMRS